MILGMSVFAFTILHTAISLIGILAGPFVLRSFITGQKAEGWTTTFLVFTILTSVTGFFFPITVFGPPQIIGVLSLIVLAVALIADYLFHFAGPWRWIYVVSMVVAFYFNFFVLVAQLFDKIPPLKALAPTASEPPFMIAQVVVLVVFVYLGFKAVKQYHPMRPAF
jgi:hypothetical protein